MRITGWTLLIVVIAAVVAAVFFVRKPGVADDTERMTVAAAEVRAKAKPVDIPVAKIPDSQLSTPPITNDVLRRSFRFLELARRHLPVEDGVVLGGMMSEGTDALPGGFAGMANLFAELFGRMLAKGTFAAYCKSLRNAHRENPDDIDVLRGLVAAASVEEAGMSAEDRENLLRELFARDSRQDVAWLLGDFLLSREDYPGACSVWMQSAQEHPEQAAQVLSLGLERLAGKRELKEYGTLVSRLKEIDNINPLDAMSCADVLLKDGELGAAAHFYTRCQRDGVARHQQELAQLGLANIAVQQGRQTSVEALQKLCAEGSTPAARLQARQLLVALKAEIPGQRDNSNQVNGNEKGGKK